MRWELDRFASIDGRAGDPAYTPAPTSGFEDLPTGADLILDPPLIHKHFPFLSEDVIAALHTRRCGRMSAQQLGMYMLEQARKCGTRLLHARVEGVDVQGGRVRAVRLSDGSGSQTIATDTFVNAAGPFVKAGGRDGGRGPAHLSVSCTPRSPTTTPWASSPRARPCTTGPIPSRLPWSDEERELLAESEEMQWLLEPFPSGPHGLPEGTPGSRSQLCLWTYDIETVEPVVPLPPHDPHYFEVVLRGLSRMIPGLRGYFDRLPRPVVDGGYYAKTRENRPLIGPLPVEGAYIIGALSGFGIMAGCGAGELLAAHVTGGDVPPYAHWFLLERYEDPSYRTLLDDWDESGQL